MRLSLNIVTAMGTHGSFIFGGYNPYIGGSKPSFFMVLGSKGGWWQLKHFLFSYRSLGK